MSRPVVTVSHEPDRALRMPDSRHSDATTRSAGLEKRGVIAPAVKLATCVRFWMQLPHAPDLRL